MRRTPAEASASDSRRQRVAVGQLDSRFHHPWDRFVRIPALWGGRRRELPAIDREMLSALVDHFEQVIAEGPNAQKKALLRRLAKRVLVHDRRTIEVRYGLPNSRGFEDYHKNPVE